MNTTIIVKHVMTRHPYFVEEGANLNSAKVMFKQLKVQHLPVKRGQDLVGVISLRDIQRAEAMGIDTSIGCDSTVGNMLSDEVYIVDQTAELPTVLRHMASHHCDAALVVDQGNLVGIFTVTDACRCYADTLISEGE